MSILVFIYGLRALPAFGLTRRQSFCLLPDLPLLNRQLVSDVLLVDIGNVGDRLLANVLGRNHYFLHPC